MRNHPETPDDEILPEYDLRGGVRGKYAAEYAKGIKIVLRDSEDARHFPDAGSTNEASRAPFEQQGGPER
jgi:hypothetical protein